MEQPGGSLNTVFKVTYYGEAPLDRRYTQPMLPWVIASVRRGDAARCAILQITGSSVKAWTLPSVDEGLQHGQSELFEHKLQSISRFSRSSADACCFAYLHRPSSGATYSCHVFEACEEHQVKELFNSVKDATIHAGDPGGGTGSAASSTESLPCTSHFTEVLYTGKARLPDKKAPPTFIDDAVDRFQQHDVKKARRRINNENDADRRRHTSGSSINSLPGTLDPLHFKENELAGQAARLEHSGTGEPETPDAFVDKKTGSVDNLMDQKYRDKNRTMLFQIGKQEISLISPDKKSILLEKKFKDISFCSQGYRHAEHFGFICGESTTDNYVCYVFRGQSSSVVDEIMATLKQAFTCAYQTKPAKYTVCEQCPMQQFHKLCVEMEGMPPDKIYMTIMKRLETMPDEDQSEILDQLAEAHGNGRHEKNDQLMTLIRLLCERKQKIHVHYNEGISKLEFSIFDSKKAVSSTFDHLRSKAKKSINLSFDLLRRKSIRDDQNLAFRQRSATFDSTEKDLVAAAAAMTPPRAEFDRNAAEFSLSPIGSRPAYRPRSHTIASGVTISDARMRSAIPEHPESPVTTSPMINMFMKVNTHPKNGTPQNNTTSTKDMSYRKKIFTRVNVTPVHGPLPEKDIEHPLRVATPVKPAASGRRSPTSYRALWKKAIIEQILLIRMEKENLKLKALHDEKTTDQVQLDYEDITPCLSDASQVWTELLNAPERESQRIDPDKLLSAVKAGVPRSKRGQVWVLLVEQHLLKQGGSSSSIWDAATDPQKPYDELLKELTSHQHHILLDLGRTFPQHAYFTKQLGAGQLALFNILKAYSLCDGEVGYCQGLSFVAAVLLLHMGNEEKAFCLLKFLMFRVGFRRQYKPDMSALQIQMYQLSRLLHDQYRDLYEHFEQHEIVPSLYAAPWFLTVFSSQFPLRFVARVFDLVFLHGIEVIFRVALVLLGTHREQIMQCSKFESVMDFLKTSLPSMGVIPMERIFNQVFQMDISKQLHAYEVEYHVLHEELVVGCCAHGDTAYVAQLEGAVRNLKSSNMELLEQLQLLHGTVHGLEDSCSSYKSTVSTLRARVRGMERDKANLLETITKLKAHVPPDMAARMLDVTQLNENGSETLPKNCSSSSLDLDKEIATFNLRRAEPVRLRRLSGESGSSRGTESPLIELQ